MNIQPLVSIALCTYNGEKYLKDQLDSIINQTYKNIEIIVVDDCSSDNTSSILSEYQSRYSQLHVFINTTNLGYNKNFEKAITLCSGEYIAVSDQDDIWVNHKIETMMKNWKTNTVLMHHAAKSFNSSSLPILSISTEFDYSKLNKKHIIISSFVQGCTVLFHSSLKTIIFPFNKTILYDWWIGFCAFYSGEVQFLHQNLIYHRKHDNSAHYSLKRSRLEIKRELVKHIKYFINSGLLSNNDLKFAQNALRAYSELLKKKFSLKTFLFNMKHRSIIYWTKKNTSILSHFVESIKQANS
jgi:glycosyltransferase involved in cell wall biosynthesis